MKAQTAAKLQEYVTNERLKFTDVEQGLAIDHNLNDNELKELVTLEYGETDQSVDDLFKCICKTMIKLALEKSGV